MKTFVIFIPSPNQTNRVHDVIVDREPSLNPKEHNKLIARIFVANPFIFQDHGSAGFKKQSEYVQRLFTETQYLFCIFHAVETGNRTTFYDISSITVLSERIQPPYNFGNSFSVIKCEIPRAIYPLLDIIDLNKWTFTPLHVTLVDPFYLFQSNVSMNISTITVPICPNYPINNGMDLIQSLNFREDETAEHLESDPVIPTVQNLREQKQLKMNNDNPKKYNLGSCVIVHPKYSDFNALYNRGSQVIQKIHEWMEYAKYIIGVDHFYFYQHIRPDDDNDVAFDSNMFWEHILSPYFDEFGSDLISYIEWKQPYTKWFMFQISMMNSCVRLFGGDARYLMMMDIDEILIPNQWMKMTTAQSTLPPTVYDIIHEIDMKEKSLIGEFRVHCHIGITCPDQWGCEDDRRFHTFLERHQCIINTSDPEIYVGDTRKVIVNPDLVEYQFVHFVDVFRVLNKQYADGEPLREDDDAKYRYKYLGQNNGERVLSVDLKDAVQCVHMKVNKEVLDIMDRIEKSEMIENVNDYLRERVLNYSRVFQRSHGNGSGAAVLPYLKGTDSLCPRKGH